MKTAIIQIGVRQHQVKSGDRLLVDYLVNQGQEDLRWQALLVFDKDEVQVGQPLVEDVWVSAKIIEPVVRADKVTSIRFRAKKRVHKRRGHRQQHTLIEIDKIGI